jgi:hypothetical protein
MISSVSNATPATDQTQSAAAQSPTVYETPFGDVLASQITGINLEAWVTGGSSGVASPATAAGKDEAALSTTGTVKPSLTTSNSTSGAIDDSSSGSTSTTTTPGTTASLSDVPTVESLFGSNPWLSDPGGSGDGVSWNYNPIYFATQQTAETVAQMLGGTVVAENAITSAAGSPLEQSQPNEMVQLSSGAQVNAGLVADLFNHGYSQGYIDQELTGIEQQGGNAS